MIWVVLGAMLFWPLLTISLAVLMHRLTTRELDRLQNQLDRFEERLTHRDG